MLHVDEPIQPFLSEGGSDCWTLERPVPPQQLKRATEEKEMILTSKVDVDVVAHLQMEKAKSLVSTSSVIGFPMQSDNA